MDSTAHPEMLLAAVAQRRRAGAGATTARSSSPCACDGAHKPGRVVHGGNLDHEPRATDTNASSLRLPHAIRPCCEVSGWVQPPDAENRTSGGVGGCRGAIPVTRPDPGYLPTFIHMKT